MNNLKKPTILIVDDTPESLKVLIELLNNKYRIKVALDGEKALKLLLSDDLPDLILLDIMMPGMDGYEVCRRIKMQERIKSIPVLFISAIDAVEDKVKAFSHGGVDYLSKPFEITEVDARVATHLRLREQQVYIEKQYEKLQELENMRDGLVHMIVHDIRSPLSCILGFAELLNLNAEEPKKEDIEDNLKYIESIKSSSRKLIEMISSLLDVSKMESGELPLKKSLVDVSVLCMEVIKLFQAEIDRNKIQCKLPEISAKVEADVSILNRILTNLLSNAIQFTPSEGVVSFKVVSNEEEVYISVTDTGPGIPEEYHTRIFEKFGQVEGASEGRKYSSGVGLAFCKLAVEAHGGKIGVESTKGVGSTFFFTLPVYQ